MEAIGTASPPAGSSQTNETAVIDSAGELAVEEEPVRTDVQPEEPPAEELAPARPVAPLVIPTAVSLTNRGIERLNEGRVQESIDQFTKALAMDPKYAEAWERRAEAYAQMGRNYEADEDRRRLATIDPV